MAGRVEASSFPQEINPSITGNAFLDTLIESIRSFIRRFLPCLWQGDREIQIPAGPLSAPFINERVAIGKECLQKMLRPAVEGDDPAGIQSSLLQNTQAVVVIKYNNVTEVAFATLNGAPSLEPLKQSALQKLETVIRANREAHFTELSIHTKLFYGLRRIYTGERAHYYDAVDKYFEFKPDNSSRNWGGASSTTGQREGGTREYLIRTLPSPQTQAELERFLFP